MNAEDPSRGFMPSPGHRSRASVPPLGPGVRVDTHVVEGYRVPPNYDSLVAKLVVWDADRDAALDRAPRARSASSRSTASARRASCSSTSSTSPCSAAASTPPATCRTPPGACRASANELAPGTRPVPAAGPACGDDAALPAVGDRAAAGGAGRPLRGGLRGRAARLRARADRGRRGEACRELDAEIDAHAHGWTPDRISPVERAALHIATLELLDRPDVPAGAAIEEAVRLARRYASPEAASFVNGVLGAIARAHGVGR